MQLAENFPDLASLYGQGPLSGYMGMDQTLRAKKSQELNQQAALEEILYKQQARPERVRGLQLQNDTVEKQLPGVEADSWEKQRNMAVRKGIDITDEQRVQMSKIATQLSDDQWKQEETAFNMALRSPSAAVRQQAQAMLPYLKEFQKIRYEEQQKRETQEALQKLKNEGALAVADKKATISKAVADAKAKAAQLKMSPQQAIIYYRDLKSKVDPESDEYEVYDRLEAAALRDAYALTQLKPVAPGTVNPAQTTGLPATEPVQAPPTMPKKSDTGNAWIERAMKANPGMTREQIIEEGKRRGKL